MAYNEWRGSLTVFIHNKFKTRTQTITSPTGNANAIPASHMQSNSFAVQRVTL